MSTQLCKVTSYWSNVEKMGNKGIFAHQMVEDYLYICVYILIKSVVKAYKTPTKLQTKTPSHGLFIPLRAALWACLTQGAVLLLLSGHKAIVQPERAAHPTVGPKRLNPFWSNQDFWYQLFLYLGEKNYFSALASIKSTY